MVYYFFFKQKTAYEMRISDSSSDVCSFDLSGLADADQLDHLASRVLCLAMLGEIHRQRGDDSEALRAAEAVRAAANSGDFALWYGLSDGLAGWVRARRGERGALDEIRHAIHASRTGMPVLPDRQSTSMKS